jgi:hypothetical protein
MPTLLWRGKADERRLIANTPLTNASEVLLEGTEYPAGLPSHFYLYRTYAPVTRKFLGTVGKDVLKNLDEPFVAQKYDPNPQTARSEHFPLTVKGLFFHTHRWLFKDNFDNWSKEVRTARFGGFDLTLKGGAHAGVAHGTASVKTKVTTCLDPQLEISVLFPWQTPDPDTGFSVRELVDEEARLLRQDFNDETAQGFRRFLLDYLERYAGWDFEPSRTQIELAEGESTSLDVNVIIGEGKGLAFAIQAKDTRQPKESFVSDIIIIQQSDDTAVLMGD